MNAKNFFTAVAVVDLLFGISLVFSPAMITDEYLVDTSLRNTATDLLCQGYGSLLFSFGIGAWMARDSGPSIARRALLIMGLVSSLALLVIHPMAILNNTEKPFAWVTVILAVVFVAWSGMLLMKEKDLVN